MKNLPRYSLAQFVILVILMLLCVGCSDATDAEKDQAQQMADEFLKEEGNGDESTESADVADAEDTGDSAVEEPEVKEPPTFSVAETFNNPLFESIDGVLDLIFREPLPIARAEIVFTEELAGDNIFGDSSVTPLGEDPAADIILSGQFTLQIPTDTDYPILDFVVPCGMQNAWGEDPSVWVSCAGEGDVGEISTWHVFFGAMQDSIPRFDDTRYRTIAVVLDSDNLPDNNFVPTFDYDFYQGTDLWYQWTSSPQEGWMPMVVGENFQEVPSHARALFYGNTFAVFIPGNEIPAKDAGYTIAADSHLGMLDPNNFFGNVLGGDPTQALSKMNPEKKLTLYINKEGYEKWLEGPYQPCLTRGCKELPEYKGDGNFPEEIWCECTGCTEDPDCGCYVFANLVPLMWEISKEKRTWFMIGYPGEKVKIERGMLYDCFCVKELK